LPLLNPNFPFSLRNYLSILKKDKFLRVAIKRMTKTQIFEDKLKQVKDLNENLMAHNQELESRLVEASQEKSGK
jgi:hypothetical protein